MSVTDEAILKMKELILSGRLRPGDRLPRERDLAVQLGLSRSSLREAVRALSLIGVLDVRQGDGTYVTSLEPRRLLETTGFVLELLQDSTTLEMLQVRRLLEPAATALAAVRITDEDLRELKECIRHMNEASSVEELVEADDRFHKIIVEATGNATLASLVKSFSTRTFRARVWRGMTDEEALERTKSGHQAIYCALLARDPELARSAATMHIAEVEQWFKQALELVSSNEQDPAEEVKKA